MRKHFRKFVTVYNEEMEPVYFRYYDPRVFRVYLPTCNAGELDTVFGPVETFCVEDRDPSTLIKYEVMSGRLVPIPVTLAAA